MRFLGFTLLTACSAPPTYISFGGDAGDAASSVVEAGSDGAVFYPLPDGGTVAADRFVTHVVSFEAGPCAGFGQSAMPGVVYGPPVGGGLLMGSTDVVSLGNGGTIVVSFEPNAIVDGPGPDFTVFENPFYVAGNKNNIYAEPGIVSVSDDGVTWTSFPCTATAQNPPYGLCGGWHPVIANWHDNTVSPLDPNVSGGDVFDLATVGITHARYIKITDHSAETCPTDPSQPHPTTNGFDLDAIAILNAEAP